MRFFDNGRMLYSLDTIEPEDMAKHLALATETPKKIFEGSYTLVGKKVHVEVSTSNFFFCSSPTFTINIYMKATHLVLQYKVNCILPLSAYFALSS